MPAARFGLHYYPSGLRRYTQKVSPSFAKRAFLLSEDFSDADLLAVGYLDWLVERTEFKGKIDEISNRLATLAPLSMVNMKRAIEQYAQAEPDVPSIRQNMRECATSEDLREGLAALRERRHACLQGPLIDHATSPSRHRPRRHRGLHPHDGGLGDAHFPPSQDGPDRRLASGHPGRQRPPGRHRGRRHAGRVRLGRDRRQRRARHPGAHGALQRHASSPSSA